MNQQRTCYPDQLGWIFIKYTTKWIIDIITGQRKLRIAVSINEHSAQKVHHVNM